jgi:hypothetical protein
VDIPEHQGEMEAEQEVTLRVVVTLKDAGNLSFGVLLALTL